MADKPILLSPWTNNWDSALEKLAELGIPRSFQPGAVIFSEAEQGHDVYVLIKGRVKLSLNYPHGSELVLSIYENKRLFGIQSVLDGAPHFATATTLMNCDIVVIRESVFFSLLEAHPDLNRAVLRCLAMEVRQFSAQSSCLCLTDASARVTRMLAITARAESSNMKQPTITTTHDEIGSILGLSRVSVTNALNSLEEAGVIKKKRSQLIISDLDYCEGLLDNKKSVRTKVVK